MASKSRAASTAFKRSKKQADGELRASWCRPSRSLRRCPRNICRKVGKPRAVKRQRSTHRNNESAFQKREALQEIGPLFLGQTVLHSQETTTASGTQRSLQPLELPGYRG